MRKLALSSLALVVFAFFLASPAAALSVTINGPTTVWVPFAQCATANWTASVGGGTATTYDWAFNGGQASSTSGYSGRFCSPGLPYATTEHHILEIWVTGGGQAAYDSHYFKVIYQAGDENGSCGTQIFCE